jgi:hypothetical protein
MHNSQNEGLAGQYKRWLLFDSPIHCDVTAIQRLALPAACKRRWAMGSGISVNRQSSAAATATGGSGRWFQ